MKRFGFPCAFAILVGAAGCNGSSGIASAPPATQPAHAIRHIVILLQENRSFNNLFMGFPGAETAATGKCEPAPWCPKSGEVPIRSVRLESTGQFALGTDIGNDHATFEIECDADASNVCRNDGFDKITLGQGRYGPPAKLYPYRAVERSEIKAYWDFASRYGIADKMFFTATAGSFIAHQQIIAGTTRINAHESLIGGPDATPGGCEAPPGTVTAIIKKNGKVNEFGGPFPCFTQYKTMADVLDAAGTSWKFYVSSINGDFSGDVWNGFDSIRKVRLGPDWHTNISFPSTNVFKDVKARTLPAVSWVIPKLADSDHPTSGCNHGPHWITSVVNAIGTSQYWNSTAIILLWDDWGGWYDPVPPPQVNYTGLGFRVPMVVISPYAKPHFVGHTHYDFGSVLKFIEQTFDLGSLDATDATANSMSEMFDLSQRPNPFHKEPLPPTRSCGAESVTTQQIIEHDNGVPE